MSRTFARALALLGWSAAVAGACLFELDDPSRLCEVMSAETCAEWTGGALGVTNAAIACSLVNKNFELTCAAGAIFDLGGGAFKVDVDESSQLVMRGCSVEGSVVFSGRGNVTMEEVVVSNGAAFEDLHRVELDRVVVELRSFTANFKAARTTIEVFSLTVTDHAQVTARTDSCIYGDELVIYGRKLTLNNCHSVGAGIDLTTYSMFVVDEVDIDGGRMSHALNMTDVYLELVAMQVAGVGATGAVVNVQGFGRSSIIELQVLRSSGATPFRFVGSYNRLFIDLFIEAFNTMAEGVQLTSGTSAMIEHWVSSCNSVGASAAVMSCSMPQVTVDKMEVDVGNLSPGAAMVGCHQLLSSSLVMVLYTDRDDVTEFGGSRRNPVLPPRGVCASGNLGAALNPVGYAVRMGIKTLASLPLADGSRSFDAVTFDAPLALVDVPAEIAAGSTLHEIATGGLFAGESLEFECIPGPQPCEFFVSIYSCGGCIELSRGLWPSLLAGDHEWERGACAPKFGPADDVSHPMVTFRAEVAVGEVLRLPAVDGPQDGFVVFARRASDPPVEWCPKKPFFGPVLPSTCSQNCFGF